MTIVGACFFVRELIGKEVGNEGNETHASLHQPLSVLCDAVVWVYGGSVRASVYSNIRSIHPVFVYPCM